MIEDFLHLPPVSLTPVAILELQISPQIFEKIRNDSNDSGAWGKLIREKNQKSKISWHCPFKTSIISIKAEAVKLLKTFVKRYSVWSVHFLQENSQRAYLLIAQSIFYLTNKL